MCKTAANASLSDKNDLETELVTMKQMESHPNITNFLGMCSETGEGGAGHHQM
jgi:hypothetical protein